MGNLSSSGVKPTHSRDRSTSKAVSLSHLGETTDSATMNLSLRKLKRRERDKNARAQARRENGEYGICQDCRQAISEARLAVLPYAERCIDCQLEVEHKAHHRHGQVSDRKGA
jgi:RNA polymerase-binding transcription factor DksA